VVVDLLWKPFDARFSHLLEDLSFHRQVLRDEVLLLQIYGVEGLRKEAADERVEAQHERFQASKSRMAVEETHKTIEEVKSLIQEQKQGMLIWSSICYQGELMKFLQET